MKNLLGFLDSGRWEGFETRQRLRLHKKSLRALPEEYRAPNKYFVRARLAAGRLDLGGSRHRRARPNWGLLALVLLASSICGLCQTESPAAVTVIPAGADAPTLKKPIHGDDPDTSRSKEKSVPLAEANVHFSITFDRCRENEKHHVSCAFTDAEGYEHWVYLAGATWPIHPQK